RFHIVPALNLAICWKHFFNFSLESQSAGNLIDLEHLRILRDYTPQILCSQIGVYAIKTKLPSTPLNKFKFYKSFSTIDLNSGSASRQKENSYNPLFCSYLAGLIEGDGTIIVPKTERSNKGKLNYPSIQIVFDARDLPIAVILQKELGFGTLSKTKGSNSYRLSFNTGKSIFILTEMLNGYMRTVKINMLNSLIDYLNIKNNMNILTKDLDVSPIDSNSWLSGFIEADGHFYVNYNKKASSLSCKFYLNQSTQNHLGLDKIKIMETLSEFLNVKIASRGNKKFLDYREYSITTNSVINNLKLINYLDKFPLFSSKHLNYLDFKSIVKMIENKEHKIYGGIEKINLIKMGMNNRRKFFNWDHLQKFYTAYNDKI
uniref:LAGLIDADG homing endonuclease n=1 Tax=Cyathus striatus TaxID=68777 RepID=UPI0023F5823A